MVSVHAVSVHFHMRRPFQLTYTTSRRSVLNVLWDRHSWVTTTVSKDSMIISCKAPTLYDCSQKFSNLVFSYLLQLFAITLKTSCQVAVEQFALQYGPVRPDDLLDRIRPHWTAFTRYTLSGQERDSITCSAPIL